MVQSFKINRTYFWINYFKDWSLAILLMIPILFYVIKISQANTVLAIILVALFSFSRLLTQFHIEEIQVDQENNQLTFQLKSFISGEKIKQEDLRKVSSKLIVNSGIKRIFKAPYFLNIYMPDNRFFKISNQYGFSLESLNTVDYYIKNSNTNH